MIWYLPSTLLKVIATALDSRYERVVMYVSVLQFGKHLISRQNPLVGGLL